MILLNEDMVNVDCEICRHNAKSRCPSNMQKFACSCLLEFLCVKLTNKLYE